MASLEVHSFHPREFQRNRDVYNLHEDKGSLNGKSPIDHGHTEFGLAYQIHLQPIDRRLYEAREGAYFPTQSQPTLT